MYNPPRVRNTRSRKNKREETLKRICIALVAAICFFSTALAQNPPVARTDVYHVHFAKATLGKGAEEGDFS
jgi:hypothetical protein